MMFKENNYKPVSTADRVKLTDDAKTQQMYAQMYQLAPQRYPDPDDDVNAGQIKESLPNW